MNEHHQSMDTANEYSAHDRKWLVKRWLMDNFNLGNKSRQNPNFLIKQVDFPGDGVGRSYGGGNKSTSRAMELAEATAAGSRRGTTPPPPPPSPASSRAGTTPATA